MKRSMFQIYVVGSDKAAELYQKAFDAKLVWAVPSEDGDGTYFSPCMVDFIDRFGVRWCLFE